MIQATDLVLQFSGDPYHVWIKNMFKDFLSLHSYSTLEVLLCLLPMPTSYMGYVIGDVCLFAK